MLRRLNENSVNSTANQQREREREKTTNQHFGKSKIMGNFQAINKTLEMVVSGQFAWGCRASVHVKGSLCDATRRVDDGCCAGELRNRFFCPYGTRPMRSGTPC